MLTHFKQFIKEKCLIEEGHTILVAISGGVDSMVLAYLLMESGYDIALAHCNYHLRGKDSDLDQELVESFAAESGLQVYTKQCDTQAMAEEEGISIQMAAREQRYSWFMELAEQHGFDRIATGHHQNDHAETILINLIRGSGFKGLQGIPVKRDRFIRPMLFTKRDEILQYARANNIKWREDRTNQDTKYQRNLIRNELMPILKTINPNLEDTLGRMATHMSDAGKVLETAMEKLSKEVVHVEGDQQVVELEHLEGKFERGLFLHHCLSQYEFNQFQIASISDGSDVTGKIYYSTTHVANIDRGRLLIAPKETKEEYYEIYPDTLVTNTHHYDLHCRMIDRSEYKIKDDNAVAAIDPDLIEYPLKIRNWREGDHFKPLGMSGKKKISDFMIDEKIPLNLKRRQLVLTSADEVVWVIGQRISDSFKITENTKRVLEIKLLLNA